MKNIMIPALTPLTKNLSTVLTLLRQRESVRASMSRALILLMLAQPMLVHAAPFVHGAEATAQRGVAKFRSWMPKTIETKAAEVAKPMAEKAIGIDEWMAQSEGRQNVTANHTANNNTNSEAPMPAPDLKNFTTPFKIFPAMTMFQSGTSLEMGATGPAGNGPSTTAQAVTLFENASIAYTPTTTVTYTLSNQQFGPGTVQGLAANSAINFGGSGNAAADSPIGGFALYSLMNGISASTNAMYTACNSCTAGTTIDVATNRSISLNLITDALINAANTNLQALNARVYYGDLTISFNRPVSNPVLQLTGLGGISGISFNGSGITKNYDLGFSTEFDLVGSNVTLSKLNGNSVLNVTSTSITNSATRLGSNSAGAVQNGITRTAASGSVLATGTNITSITLKMYVRGDGGIVVDSAGTVQTPDAGWEPKWAIAAGYLPPGASSAFVGSIGGDTILVGASMQKPVTVSGTVFNDTNGLSDSIINGTGTNAGGVNAILVDAAGNVVASTAVAADGTYSFTGIGEGSYTLRLSTTAGTQGAAAPAISLPATWFNRGEGTAAAGDGTVNGNTAITVASGVNLTGVNFGIAQPSLSLAKANPASFTTGTAANYTLTVSNAANRPTTGTSVVVNDKLPPNFAYNSAAAGTGATGASCTSSGTLAAGLDLVCTITTAAGIAGGSSAAFTLNVTPQTAAGAVAGINKAAVDPAGGTPVAPSTCTATGTPAGCALAPSITPTVPPPDLTLAKSHTGNFTVGSTGTYSFTVTNSGGSASAGTITISDTLPTGLSVNGGAVGAITEGGANAANWTCISNAVFPQVITCTSTTAIAASGSSIFTFPVDVGLGAAVGTNSITNTAAVSGGGEITTTNNSASDPTTILSPDLTIAKSHTGSFTRGSTGTYILTVSNTGTASTAGTITVTDTLPTGLTVNGGAVGAITGGGTNAANWTCNSDAAALQIITCTSTTAIATSGSSVFTFPVDVSLSAVSSVTNNVSVADGGEATANTANNTGSDPTTTVAPIIAGYKSVKLTTDADSSSSITAGDTLTYTMQYVNTGTASATNFQINDALPSGLTVTAIGGQTVTVSGSGTSATKNTSYTGAATGAVSDLLAAASMLAPGGVITVTVPVTVGVGVTGTKSNQASGSGTGLSAAVLTDNAGVTTDLSATVIAAPYSLTIPASSVAQTIAGTVDPTTVTIIAAIPTVVAFKSVKLTTDADSSGTITAGDTLTYTVQYANTGTVDVPAFQIADQLPTGLTITAAGAQTVTVTGSGTSATKDAAYTGAALATSMTLATGATLAKQGTITVTIPVTINAGFTGSLSNQASGSGTGMPSAVSTDNAGVTADLSATVIAAPYNLTVPASSVAQTIAATVDPTTVTVVAPALNLAGKIFEDVNYGGGAGRDFISSSGIARAGVRVELYNSTGAYVGFTFTNATGDYTFTGLAAANYTVRVVDAYVTSSRTGGCTASADGVTLPACSQFAVQTFRTSGLTGNVGTADTNRVGGETPTLIDAGANTTSATFASLTTATTTPQSITSVTLGTSSITGIDFGFNFDTIVSTRDSSQGSLRQFITNSNALSNSSLAQVGQTVGKEVSIFMIPDGNAHAGLRAGLTNQLTGYGAALISLASAITISDSNTSLDGSTQTANVGNTNNVTLGDTTTLIGIAGTTLAGVNGPEIEIVGIANSQGANTIIANTAIRAIGISSTGVGTEIRNNLVNTIAANSITATGSSLTSIAVSVNANNVIVDSNFIRGISVPIKMSPAVALSGIQITNNELTTGNTANAYSNNACINFTSGTNDASAANTLIEGNYLHRCTWGVVSDGNATGTGTVIRQNTISGNANAGISINFGENNHTVYRNVITANGVGVLVSGSSDKIKISENSIFANTSLGIDLHTATVYTAQGVTANDGIISASGGNKLIDYPISTSSVLSSGNLTVKGFIGISGVGNATFANATIEVFKADDDGNNNGEVIAGDGLSKAHGEGKTYLGTITADANGLFNSTFAVTGLAAGDSITMTATNSANNTSEFSADFKVETSTSAYESVTAYKSVKLTTDVSGNNTIDPGDTLTYTINYLNTGVTNINSFQANDLLPTGLTLAGAPTVTVAGTGTTASVNGSYTGAAAGAVSNLLASGAVLKVDGTITITVPVTVNAGVSGTISNQALGTGTELLAAGILSDNAGVTADLSATVIAAPYNLAVTAGSIAQTIAATIDPTVLSISGIPVLGLVKSVTPTGDQVPGTDLTYKIVFTNTGNAGAQGMVIFDPVPNDTDFKLGSQTMTPGTTGLTMVAEFSNDFVAATPATATWTYVPVTAGGGADIGYDRNVKAVRWRVSAGTLSQTSPNHTGEVGFMVKIR